MENILLFAVKICIHLYEAFVFFMIMKFCVGYEKACRSFAAFGWIAIALSLVLIKEVFALNDIVFYIVMLASELCYAHWCFDRSIAARYFFAFSGLTICSASKIVSVTVMSFISPGSMNSTLSSDKLGEICAYIFVLTALFLCMVSIKPRDVLITRRLKVFLLIIILLSIVNVSLLLMFLRENEKQLSSVYPILISCMVILVVAALAVLLSYRLAVANRRYVDEQLLLRRHENELKHYEQMGVIFDSMRSNKHDFNLHLRTILGMSAHNNSREISEYVQSLLENTQEVTQRVNTGNVSVDALISERVISAEAKDIEFSSTLFLPKELPIPATDFCAILGNLLDNAAEACLQIESGRYIKLSITPKESMLHIHVENSCNGKYRQLKDTFLTTKSDESEHGLGLARINALTRKHKGASHFKPGSDRFSADVFLPLKETEQ